MSVPWPGYDIGRWCLECGATCPEPCPLGPEETKWCACLFPKVFGRGVQIHGNVKIGSNVSICEPAEINGTGSEVVIGDGCDIAAFAVINVADSHLKCVELSKEIQRSPIVLEDHVFVGSHSIILGGTIIGHHSVIGSGVVLVDVQIPPYSKVQRTDSYQVTIGQYERK